MDKPKANERKYKGNEPGRSVISNNETATKNISSFLDFYCKWIAPTIPHILMNTKDFLRQLNGISEITTGTVVVTFEFVGLYPYINYEEWI